MSTIRSGVWRLDPAHTQIRFTVRHLVGRVRGHFDTSVGTLRTASDIAASTAHVQIDLSSINTGDEDRNSHLRSSDFFSIETHPTMTFVTTDVVRRSDTDFTVRGDLTIKDITKSVELDVEYLGERSDPSGGTRIGVDATAQISRKAWGIDFNVPLEGDRVMIGDRITIAINAEAVLDSDLDHPDRQT